MQDDRLTDYAPHDYFGGSPMLPEPTPDHLAILHYCRVKLAEIQGYNLLRRGYDRRGKPLIRLSMRKTGNNND